jgi:lysine 2,3-aminomutase
MVRRPGTLAARPGGDWRDWTWQLKNRMTTSKEQLEQYMTLTEEEKAGCEFANKKLALAITPYFFNLIDRNDPDARSAGR